tara:strand:+ start:41 stop:790 length:750 start_codon:yes stop_codon:yes gene_type:complete
MGQVEVKGKMKNMEVVPAGMYRLQLPDETFVYAESVDLRVFVQRFMYKRYDSNNNMYIKSLMADDLNNDLKDNIGGLNCGKPAGYIKDFQALPDDVKTLIKQIKRVRVVLGEVRLVDPVDQDGNEVEVAVQPFIWEIDNRDAFKTMGEPFTQLAKQRRLPVQHWINCGAEERSIPTGAKFYVPTAKLDLTVNIDLVEEDQTKFSDFMEWINNYNQYIVDAWNEKRTEKLSKENEDLVEQFIEIEPDEEK